MPSRRSVLVLLAALLATSGGLSPDACAQQNRPKRNPYLVQERAKPWTLRVNVRVSAYERQESPNSIPTHDVWRFRNAAVVFPLIETTASSERAPEDEIVSRLEFDDRVVDEEVEILEGYPMGTKLGKWVIADGDITGRELELEVSIPMRSGRTKFNDRLAGKLDWPKGWPEEAMDAFKPQMGIDVAVNGRAYDMRQIDDKILQWTEGNDIKSLKPVVAAKFLCGKVVEEIQMTGNGLNTDPSTASLEGVELKGSVLTLRDGRGSPFDMTCLLAAVYRRAGIPARVVIGYDVAAEKSKGTFLKNDGKGRDELRSWVEFALYDEAEDLLTWVPVDPVAMRKKSNRMLDDYWTGPMRYFGTHDELDEVCPFSFHFFPPTTVRGYGSPGFWGWLVSPRGPERAFQSLRFDASRTATRGNNRRDR